MTSVLYTFKLPYLPLSLSLTCLLFSILFYCCLCFVLSWGMELQLGLALPAYTPAVKELELKGCGNEAKQKLGSQPWNFGCESYVKNKRGFGEAFEKIEDHDHVPDGTLLPLLLWHGQPNEEEDHNGLRKRASCPINKNGEEENEVVGWPPVKSWRKKLICQHQGGRMVLDRTAEKQSGGAGPIYVKVKMEGVAIARKINLKLYQSYQTLTNSLIAMFARCKKCDVDCVHYTLTYQDKEGDWLLAGDVPWKTFIGSVQRLEIVRNGG